MILAFITSHKSGHKMNYEKTRQTVIKFLINKCNLSEGEAKYQLIGLNINDALILKEFYQHGLRRDDIWTLRENNDYQYYALYHGAANPKNRDDTPYFSVIDVDDDVCCCCQDISETCYVAAEKSAQGSLLKVKLDYCKSVFLAAVNDRMTPRDALLECVHEFYLMLDEAARKTIGNGGYDMRIHPHEFDSRNVSIARDKFLKRYANGIERENAVRVNDIPERMFSVPNQKAGVRPSILKTYNNLHFFAHVPAKQALAQINGLDDNQLSILKKYYKQGVRKHMLIGCTMSLTEFQVYLRESHLSPVTALKNIQEDKDFGYSTFRLGSVRTTK